MDTFKVLIVILLSSVLVDNYVLSRFLGTINRQAPIDQNVEHYKTKPRQDGDLAKLLSELEFFSMLEK